MVINNFPKKETGPLMPLVAPCRRCSQHSTAAFHPPLPSSTDCAGSWGSSHLLMWLHLWQHFKKWWKQHDLKCQSKSIGVCWAFLWEGEKAQEYSSWPPFCTALYVLSGGLWIWGGFHYLQDFQGRLWSSESNTNPYRSNNLIKLGYKYCIGNKTQHNQNIPSSCNPGGRVPYSDIHWQSGIATRDQQQEWADSDCCLVLIVVHAVEQKEGVIIPANTEWSVSVITPKQRYYW